MTYSPETCERPGSSLHNFEAGRTAGDRRSRARRASAREEIVAIGMVRWRAG